MSFEGVEVKNHKFTCKLIEATSIKECDDFESDFKILSFDIENSIFERTIYCLSFCIKDSSGYIHEETLHGKEFDILNNFVSAVVTHASSCGSAYFPVYFPSKGQSRAFRIEEAHGRAQESLPEILARDRSYL